MLGSRIEVKQVICNSRLREYPRIGPEYAGLPFPCAPALADGDVDLNPWTTNPVPRVPTKGGRRLPNEIGGLGASAFQRFLQAPFSRARAIAATCYTGSVTTPEVAMRQVKRTAKK